MFSIVLFFNAAMRSTYSSMYAHVCAEMKKKTSKNLCINVVSSSQLHNHIHTRIHTHTHELLTGPKNFCLPRFMILHLLYYRRAHASVA